MIKSRLHKCKQFRLILNGLNIIGIILYENYPNLSMQCDVNVTKKINSLLVYIHVICRF